MRVHNGKQVQAGASSSSPAASEWAIGLAFLSEPEASEERTRGERGAHSERIHGSRWAAGLRCRCRLGSLDCSFSL